MRSAFHAFETGVAGGPLDFYHYSYPPTLLVLTAPLALIPYVPGLFALAVVGPVRILSRVAPGAARQGRLLLAVATPAVFVNVVGGQNGTWTAALFGAGLGFLDRRPVLAGSLLGLLVYKPQLGILNSGGACRRQALAGLRGGGGDRRRALSRIAAIWGWGGRASSPTILGLLGTGEAPFILEDGTGVSHRMLSVFVAARRLGRGRADRVLGASHFGRARGASPSLPSGSAAWRRLASGNATLLLGTCLATPYLQDYDLVFGALVVVWLWRCPVPYASDRLLQISAALLLLLPLVAAALAHLTGLVLGPLFIAPLFVVALQISFGARPAALADPQRVSPGERDAGPQAI